MSDVWRNTGWVLDAEKKKAVSKQHIEHKSRQLKASSPQKLFFMHLDITPAWRSYQEARHQRMYQKYVKRKADGK